MKKWLIMSMVLWLGLLVSGCGKQEPDGGALSQQTTATQAQVHTIPDETVSSASGSKETGESVGRDELEQAPPTKENNTNCLVQIQTDTKLGSGVLWEKQEDVWIFGTAAHVVEEAAGIEICFVEADKKVPAKVFIVNGLDLAFVQMDATALDKQVLENYDVCMRDSSFEKTEDSASVTQGVVNGEITNHSNIVEAGTQISVEGYPANGEKKIYLGTVLDPWIYVEDFDNYMLLCQSEAEPGMSGGGVFCENGELLGIVCGENEEGQLAVLPTMVIETEYELFIKN